MAIAGEKNEKYKKLLEAKRKELVSDLGKDEAPQDFGDDIDDLEEEANEAEDLGNQLALGQTVKDRINDIDMALNKIRAGKYGVCETCGKEIGEDVLGASPESRLCKDCKKNKKI